MKRSPLPPSNCTLAITIWMAASKSGRTRKKENTAMNLFFLETSVAAALSN